MPTKLALLPTRSSSIVGSDAGAAASSHPNFCPTDVAENHRVANPKTSFGKWLIEPIEAWSATEALTGVRYLSDAAAA